jgi:hypothetical protein
MDLARQTMSGVMPAGSKLKNGPVRPQAVRRQPVQPVHAGHVDAALALHYLDDDPGGNVSADAGGREFLLQPARP